MGHLPIVNNSSIIGLASEGYLSTTGELKTLWVKTFADLISDILATRAGHPVFPWIIRDKDTGAPNIGFKYIFKIKSRPIYVPGDNYPIKVELEDDYTEFNDALSEPEALELWRNELLWNAIGKKSLRRGRSLTHQMPMEDAQLVSLLNQKNKSGTTKQVSNKKTYKNSQLITIDTTQNNANAVFNARINSLPIANRIKNLDITQIQWVTGNVFCYEKVLEAWMMENIDNSKTSSLMKLLSLDKCNLLWFGNYLPYGVSGANIDIVLIHECNKDFIVTVMELKVGGINDSGYGICSKQVTEYGGFIERAFKRYGKKVTVKNVLLTGPSKTKLTKSNGVDWIIYSINNSGLVTFQKIV